MASQAQNNDRWTPEEDAILMRLVVQFGPGKWAQISQSIEGRTAKSCRLRWFNQLDPKIDHSPFRPDEDALIIKAHAEVGNKWAKIAKLFDGRRTDNAIKNRYNSFLKGGRRPNRVSAATNVDVVSHDPATATNNVDVVSHDPATATNNVDVVSHVPDTATNNVDIVSHGGPSGSDRDRPVIKVEPYPYPNQVSFDLFYRNGHPFYPMENGVLLPRSDSVEIHGSGHVGEPSWARGLVQFCEFNMQDQASGVSLLVASGEGRDAFGEMFKAWVRKEEGSVRESKKMKQISASDYDCDLYEEQLDPACDLRQRNSNRRSLIGK